MSQNTESSTSQDTLNPRPFGISWSILLVSILGLFLELMLIRWISTEIRIFAYLQNTILIVCFFGLGFGCFTSDQPIRISHLLWPLFLIVLVFSVPFTRAGLLTISDILSVFDDLEIWYKAMGTGTWRDLFHVALGLLLTAVLMFYVILIFIPIGRALGRLMKEHPRTIQAYSLNVVGSLIGTWLFVLLGVFYQPPFTWLAIAGILILPFIDRSRKSWRYQVALLALTVGLSWPAGTDEFALRTLWSPYQKLSLYPGPGGSDDPVKYVLQVNNVGYQAVAGHEKYPEGSGREWESGRDGYGMTYQYDIPSLLHPRPRKILVVGAGTGNDAAGALRHGVEHVTAVEIDPAIMLLGKEYHPEKPYLSSRVQVVVDDARSFFSKHRDTYDVISFGLLDSHTTTALTNTRLDNYVYTKESFLAARKLLKDDGVLVVSFAASRGYISDRIAGTLREVFSQEPLVFKLPESKSAYGGYNIFVSGDKAAAEEQISRNLKLKSLVDAHTITSPYAAAPATDDWPYLYLEKRRIPILYYLIAIQLFVLAILVFRVHGARMDTARWSRGLPHFFFLGAAFLLLEVHSISKASIVFGSTWQVNAVIISGVLMMILAANAFYQKFRGVHTRPVYGLLIGTCLLLYFVNLSVFTAMPLPAKILLVGLVATAPMFFSGIIFIRSLDRCRGKDAALGANLIGALAGGVMQPITFVVGLKALMLAVAFLYGMSFFFRPSE